MGNWSSCCLPGDKNSEDGESERTRILNDPTAGEDCCYPNDGVAINSKESTNYGTINNGGNKSNEQIAAWHRILNKMQANVIDVCNVDVPPVQQNEYAERTRLYQNRINQLRQPLFLKYRLPNKSSSINGPGSGYKRLTDIASSQRDSSYFKSISEQDLSLINEISDRTLIAVKKGYIVNIEEDLVVQFNP